MLNISPAKPPLHHDRKLVVGPRHHYDTDGLLGLALRRAQEAEKWPVWVSVSIAIAAAVMLGVVAALWWGT